MGEAGFPREQFLYDIDPWEASHIIRGYRRRGALQAHLTRLAAYSAYFAFRANDRMLTPEQWLPLPGLDKEYEPQPITDKERESLMEDIKAFAKLRGGAE